MSRVFVVQEPAYFDHVKKDYQPKYDISSAEAFGELVFISHAGGLSRNGYDKLLDRTKTTLRDFSDSDYLMPVGDCFAVALAAMVASEVNGGKVRLLRWSTADKRYNVQAVDVVEDLEND